MNDFKTSQIISVKKENNQVSSFIIHPTPSCFTPRKAGQYLLLRLPQGNSWSEAHPFTITSSLRDDSLKITVKRMGIFTSMLHSIITPTDVQLLGPFGEYGKNIEKKKKVIFIAGGIGITPFISLLMHLDEEKSNAHITLFWANNRVEDYFALDLLNDLSTRLNIKIVFINLELNNENEVRDSRFLWESGYLTTAIFEKYVEDKNSDFYMCGSENMQNHVFTQISELDITPENVETEKIGKYMKS